MKSPQAPFSVSNEVTTTSIGFIALTIASPVMGLVLIVPAIPEIVSRFSITENMGQSLITLYLIALGLGQLGYGIASDRFGRRPILILGSLIFAVGSGLILFANSIELANRINPLPTAKIREPKIKIGRLPNLSDAIP